MTRLFAFLSGVQFFCAVDLMVNDRWGTAALFVAGSIVALLMSLRPGYRSAPPDDAGTDYVVAEMCQCPDCGQVHKSMKPGRPLPWTIGRKDVDQ
jgi:hypothetical protein